MALETLTADAELTDRIASGDLFVAYFSTPTCNVCKVLRPKVAEIAERVGTAGVYVDTTALPETAGQRLVFAVPTVMIFGDRRELGRYGRHLSLDELEATLARYKSLMEA